MKTKLTYITISLIALLTVSTFAGLEGLGFIAPQVDDEVNVYNPQTGEIIFDVDSSEGGFKGYNGSSWVYLDTVPADTVSSEGMTEPVLYSAEINGSSSPSVLIENGDWIDSITRNSSGDYTLNLTSGAFASKPVCSCMIAESNGAPSLACGAAFTGSDWSSSSIRVTTVQIGTGTVDFSFMLVCHGSK